ncbi:MFS transporter [Sediminihabitans luteus]|uniref:MFS transporter n=1 Tax=Sediminihabitans luteus TaxID=1138585 RepID=A0A2M9D110_9CELL|nr:MFS transporter [Sediminihabitans luteus]PJJ77872.1 MFS transporter [Sediminihabitans luteus]GII99770.1 membrane transport protein [Sediminihabitans luteus]
MSSPSSSRTGAPARTATVSSLVGFLVVMELSSGFLQGWFLPLLGQIGERFDAPPSALNWVTSVFLLTSVVFVPVIAKMGDRYGHKRMLAIAAALTAIGSIVVAVAPTFEIFLLGRAISAALVAFIPLEFAIVRDRNPENAGKAIGLLIGALTLGASLGALLSGGLGEVLPLGVVLWAPAVLLALCVPVVIFLVPETSVRSTGTIDWWGAALLGLGLVMLLGGVGNGNVWGWTDPKTLVAIVGGAVVLAGWTALELRVTSPLVDLRAVGSSGVGLPIGLGVLFGAWMLGGQTPLSVFALTDPDVAGFGLGMGSAGVGLIALVAGGFAFLGASMGDRIARRIGYRATILAGSLTAGATYLVMAAWHSSTPGYLALTAVTSVAGGVLMATLPTIVVMRAPQDQVAITSSLYNTSRTASGGAAGAVFAAIMSGLVTTVGTGDAASTVASESAYVAVWLVSAGLALTFAVLALRISNGKARAGESDGTPATASTVEAAAPVSPTPVSPTPVPVGAGPAVPVVARGILAEEPA